jgi:hypothetical protein
MSEPLFAPPKPWFTDGSNLFALMAARTTVTTTKMDPVTIEVAPGQPELLISRDGGTVWTALPVWQGE